MSLVFSSRLEPGERILWEGRPDKRRFVLGPENLYLIPFSVMWGGFAIFWEASVLAGGAPFFFWLWGIPFVLVGVYLIAGRFVVAAAQADRTHYAVTDKRVLIASGFLSTTLQELDLRTLPFLQLTEGRRGVGTISFTMPTPWSVYARSGWTGFGTGQDVGFHSVPDAAAVYRTIQHARGEASR